ncbi:serine hydrolase domain-containing protein [Actinomadura fibrosa]|uniref:Serine hydrolase domain-containing protein n=1 Tax=Actinomadura fibrosa TaxID=111802 RepID=A0ABW2Y1C5_9ACTN|nr:serine hydrolase domain-containing protein [Actinomadura fibrosa]
MAVSRRDFMGGALMLAAVSACQPMAKAGLAGSASTQSEWHTIRTYLKELAHAGRFTGTVLVTQNGRPVLHEAYGMADSAKNEANTPGTRFNIGSMNKMFTGVAVAQLVQKGELSFQDTVGKYVAGFPSEIADKVTVHHLLTHTAGLGDFTHREGEKGGLDVDSIMQEIVKQQLKFEPGSRWDYSNAGFIVLGAIVERLSKQDYNGYIRRHILKPAGMHDTTFGPYTPSKVAHMAHPYALFDADGSWIGGQSSPDGSIPEGEWRDVGDQPDGATPSGGAVSMAGDVLRFSRALQGHKLLNAELTTTVMEGKAQMGPGAEYGYGFINQSHNGVRFVGHSGGTMGYGTVLEMYPTKGCTVIVLTNKDLVMNEPLKKIRTLITT